MSTLEIRHISRNFWLLTPFLLLWEKSGGSSKEEWQYLSSKLCLTKRCVSGLIEKLRSLFLFLSCTLWGLMRPRHQYLSRTHYHLDSFRSHIRYLHSGTQIHRYIQVHTTTWIAFTFTPDTFTDDLSGFES